MHNANRIRIAFAVKAETHPLSQETDAERILDLIEAAERQDTWEALREIMMGPPLPPLKEGEVEEPIPMTREAILAKRDELRRKRGQQ